MKNKLLLPLFSFVRFTSVLMIILIQLPAFAPAFDLKTSNSINAGTLSIIPNTNFPAQNNFSPLTVFSNATAITITDRNNITPGGTNGISSPYPSAITVSGMSGTVSDVNVTLTGFNAVRPRDIDVVLVAPSGQALTLMADTGGLVSTSPGINITFDDGAAALPETTAITTGTYKPTDYVFSGTDSDTFPAPGPASVNDPAPTGSATLNSVFTGVNPNGIWNLFIIDDSLGGGNSAISGGWSIDITTAGGVAATSTTVVSNLNPAQTAQSITFTSTTTQVSGGSPVTAGTVSFTNNGVAIGGCTNVSVNASGNAACTTTLAEGTRTITATYNGTASFGTSSGSISQVVNSPTVVTGSQFCNNGGISIPDPPSATNPYPSNISVSGLVGTISNINVQLNGLTAPRTSNLDFLLVGPGGQAFQMISDTGDAVTPVTGINLTLSDAAPTQMPIASVLSSGTFKPTDADPLGTDVYPAPAPGSFNQAAPTGAATFASVYSTTNPNGNWALYTIDDGVGGGTSSITGWCVDFALSKFNTTTTVTTTLNPSYEGLNVVFTATVTSSGGTPTGTVEFFDGATSLGTGTLNGSGQAFLSITSLTPGTHNITAQYLGASVGAGGGGYNSSTSSVLSQVVNVLVAADAGVTGRVLASNGRGVPNAVVTMVDSGGNSRYALTNPFGFYRFAAVQVGEGYSVSVTAKNKSFAARFITVGEDITDLDFVEMK